MIDWLILFEEMGTILTEEIFERQAAISGRRTCGAAVLCMVYRSFGHERPQDSIWAELQQPENNGAAPDKTPNLRTVALVRHLLDYGHKVGLEAVAVRLRSPWEFLCGFDTSEQRLILNHRTRANVATGHFTLFCGIEADHDREIACLHDPHLGPSQDVKKADLLSLWQPLKGHRNEISGNVAIIVAKKTVDASANTSICRHCGTTLPQMRFTSQDDLEIFCPVCDKVVQAR